MKNEMFLRVVARGKRETKTRNLGKTEGKWYIHVMEINDWIEKKYEKIKRWGKKYMTKWKKEKEVKEKILVLTCDTSK